MFRNLVVGGLAAFAMAAGVGVANASEEVRVIGHDISTCATTIGLSGFEPGVYTDPYPMIISQDGKGQFAVMRDKGSPAGTLTVEGHKIALPGCPRF